MALSNQTKILILGGGFGGLYAALRLDRTLARQPNIQVTLIDKTNFILFTPMLHEVAASDIDPSDIVNPFRKMLKHVQFFEACVESIDLQNKNVEVSAGLSQRRRTFTYDHLVLALGSETKFFDDRTRQHAVQMKSLGDAVLLRNRMIGLLEAAAIEEDPALRQRMLTFVITGGGFAGVETAGAVNDFLHGAVQFYPQLEREMIRMVLIDSLDSLLPQFSKSLGAYAADRLRAAGIDVRLKVLVESFDGKTVKLKGGDSIGADTVIWTAGVTPPKIIQTLPLKLDHGRIVVKSTMESEEIPNLWAIGDCAHIPDPKTGKPYPQTAQHAIRQGPRLAKNIEAVLLGKKQKPFDYRTIGQLAAIGRRRGVAQIFGLNFSGFFAWFLWRTTYLWKLPGFYKKIRVAMAWTLDLFFSKDVVQLITVEDVQRLTRLPTNDPTEPQHANHEHQPAEIHS